MRAAVVQFEAATDVTANLGMIVPQVRAAAAAGADLVVLPEASMHDFGAPDLLLGPVAQALDGEFVTTLAAVTAELDLTLVAGMFEMSDDPDRPYNTLVVLGPDGDVVQTYRKAHLYDSFGYRESDRLLAGDLTSAVVDVGGLRCGLLTCYDLRFPEVSRGLVDAGADVLVVPAAWVRGPLKEAHWTTLLRARAIENTTYVVGAAQAGRQYVGCSAVIDPMGVSVAALGDEVGLLLADLDRARIADVRHRNPSLANRRTT